MTAARGALARALPHVLALLLLPAVALGSGGYDYNHGHVRWHTLQTDHFVFHWPESTRPEDHPRYFTTEFSVGQLARIAEESYPKITAQFDYPLEEKVHVVLYDQDTGWEGNGFAIAEYDWTGFAANWGSTFRERGRMEFLSDVFVHEFAHVVSLKAYLPWSESSTGLQLGGLSEDEEWLRRLGYDRPTTANVDVGVDVPAIVHVPFWWVEGGAEYWSHQAGYNFWGTSRDALLRMSVVEDRVLSVDEWTTRGDKEGFDGERGYNHGYAFALWLRDRFGADVMTEMAKISAKRWHWSWGAVVKEATGESIEDLHAEWLAFLEDHYGAQVAAIRAEGVVQGREMSLTEPPWETDDWEPRSDKARDAEMDGETAWQEMPVYSPDGRYIAWFEQGFNLVEIAPEDWGAVGGTYLEEDEADRYDERWFFDDAIHWLRPDFSGDRIVVTGPEDLAPRFLRDVGLTFNADGYDWPQLLVGTIDPDGKRLDVRWEPIDNTLRATEAAWHPDGQTLAFARYGDGTHELWTIRADGSQARQLTDFGDGTQVQGVDWSADGSKILVSLFRQYQQDLWLLEPETGAWTRLTDSRADETDPSFGPDGRVWFTSDATGVFDVYSMDPESREVRRHTRMIGGAYGAWVAPGGHLFYTGVTGHGFRIHALAAEELLQEVVDYEGACPCAGAGEAIAFRPAPTGALSLSEAYSPVKASMPFSLWPVARTTDKNVEVGTGFFLGDYVEEHYLEGEVTFGKDNFISLSYWNEMFWPSLNVGWMRYSYKGTYGYGVDQDGLPETDDLSVVDVKFEQMSDDLWAFASYSPSWTLWLGGGADLSRYSFRDTGDGARFVPFVRNTGVSVFAEWSPTGDYSGDAWINPRGGRRVYVEAARRWTRVLDPETAGGVFDDGELMDAYGYWRFNASWTEFVPVPLTEHHTLQIDLEAGFIDKNVMGWDEFIAGGRHPYHWGSGTIGNNVQFSGYEGWSLSGETMLIANAAYRLPLLRDLNWKVGPMYTDAVYLQAFGTVGNLWSYRVEGDSHLEGYSVVPGEGGSVVREVPFRDHASKSSTPGQPNYWLTDVGGEIRVRAFLWNDFDWDSFVRVAYGLKPTAGYGDVNGDLIQSSLARDAATELSGEVEPPTLRVYLGIGTGW